MSLFSSRAWDRMAYITNVVLLTVPEAVLSPEEAKCRSAGKFQPCTVLLLAIPEVVLSFQESEENHFHTASGHPFLAKLGLGGSDSPLFCMRRDCLWDSEEQNREWNRMYAPRCPRGSLVPYKNGEQISCAVHFQSYFSLSQRQSVSSHTEVRSISSVGLFLRRERYVRDATQHQHCMARLNPMQ